VQGAQAASGVEEARACIGRWVGAVVRAKQGEQEEQEERKGEEEQKEQEELKGG
jgi:hypothetical protein